jgi:hypothetical protein
MNLANDEIDLEKRGKMFNNIYNYDYSDVHSARKRRLSNLVTSVQMGMKLHNLSSNEIFLLHEEFGDDWRVKLGVEDTRIQNILHDIYGGLMEKDLTPDEVRCLKDRYGPKWRESVGYVTVSEPRPISSGGRSASSPTTQYVSYADCLKHGKSP